MRSYKAAPNNTGTQHDNLFRTDSERGARGELT